MPKDERDIAHDKLMHAEIWRDPDNSFLAGHTTPFNWSYFYTSFDPNPHNQFDRLTGKRKVPTPYGQAGTMFAACVGSGAMRIKVDSAGHVAKILEDVRTNIPELAGLPEVSFAPGLQWRNAEVTIAEVDAEQPDHKYYMVYGNAAYAFQTKLHNMFAMTRLKVKTNVYNGYASVTDYGAELDEDQLRQFFDTWRVRHTDVNGALTENNY